MILLEEDVFNIQIQYGCYLDISCIDCIIWIIGIIKDVGLLKGIIIRYIVEGVVLAG